MSANDLVLVDALIEDARSSAAPDQSAQEFFDTFALTNALKNFDLSYEELASGDVDGGGDGGFDAIFAWIDGTLVDDETDGASIRKGADIELVVAQIKHATTFQGNSVDKFIVNLPRLLDLSVPLSNLENEFNAEVIAAIGDFRRVYEQGATKFPRLRIRCLYLSRSPGPPHPDVAAKGDQVVTVLGALFDGVDAQFEFVGARDLVELAREQAETVLKLTVEEAMSSANGGTVALVRLDRLVDFVTDNSGGLRMFLFESNVRDYQGTVEVNRGIAATLSEPGDEDFWWLNNGIVIVSTDTSQAGKTISIKDPEIVNGLQTTMEVYAFARDAESLAEDDRLVLVRVVPYSTDEGRARIIRATNSQTKISHASLRATDPIQRDIEDHLRHHQIYYDRRKNEHKNAGRPISSIVSITYLSQALAALVRRQPDFARARPSTLVKNDETYTELFSADYPIDIYLKAIRIQRRVDEFLSGHVDFSGAAARNNVRFHVSMVAASLGCEKSVPNSGDIAGLDLSVLSDVVFQKSLDLVIDGREKLKGSNFALASDDQVAKSSDLLPILESLLTEELAN